MNLGLVLEVDADNPIHGDLRLVNGDLVLVDGDEAVAQHMLNRLRFFFGEWYLDTRQGIPFYQSVLIKNPGRPSVRSIFRRVIRETPGISGVERLELNISAQRVATISFVAILDSGGTLAYNDLVLLPFQRLQQAG